MSGIPGIRGRPFEAMLAPQGRRRQPMPGFDREFADIVDYIVKITHRIWDRHDIGSIRRYYSADCPVWTLGGPVSGAEAVIAGTIATMAAFPDRTMVPEAVIWSGNGRDGYMSSHRIFSTATHRGPGDFGPPTGRAIRFRTIADCLCVRNRIVEEWLARDTSGMALGLGLDPRVVAAGTPAGPAVRQWWVAMHAELHGAAPLPVVRGPAAPFAVGHLGAMVAGADGGRAAYHDDAILHGAGGETHRGPDAIAGWWRARAALVEDARLRIDHVAANPVPAAGSGCGSGDVEIAARWWLSGRHGADGRWGPATGAPLAILGITHWHMVDGRIAEEVTLFDEIAVLRQILAG